MRAATHRDDAVLPPSAHARDEDGEGAAFIERIAFLAAMLA